jgi:hypothetical protein
MQQEVRLRLERLEDKEDWKQEWVKLFFFIREMVGWSGAIALVSLFLLAPLAGIFWMVYQIPGVGTLDGPIAICIMCIISLSLVGGFFYVINNRDLTKKRLYWEYHYDLRNLEAIRQRDEIIGLRKRLGLPIEDNEIPFSYESMDASGSPIDGTDELDCIDVEARIDIPEAVMEAAKARLAKEQNALRVDSSTRDVWIRGMKLSPVPKKEFDILECLFQNRGQAISWAEIAAAGWPERPDDIPKSDIAQYIRRLRRKIEENPYEPKIIITKVGYGYSIGE